MDKATRTILRNQVVIMEALKIGQLVGTRAYDHLTGSLRETLDLLHLDEAQAAARDSVSTKMAQSRAEQGS